MAPHTYHYSLRLEHDETRREARIGYEAVKWDGDPLYTFQDGEVRLHDRAPFRFASRRSYLASLQSDVKDTDDDVLALFKKFIEGISVFRFNPARMTAAATDDAPVLARDASNFGAWCRNLLSEAPDSVQHAREALKEVMPGFESLRAQSVGRGKVLVAAW